VHGGSVEWRLWAGNLTAHRALAHGEVGDRLRGQGEGLQEIHKRERFTNELALVYEDGRTLVLGERKKKEDSDAERAPVPGTSGIAAEQ
jgi:hypothetical protein